MCYICALPVNPRIGKSRLHHSAPGRRAAGTLSRAARRDAVLRATAVDRAGLKTHLRSVIVSGPLCSGAGYSGHADSVHVAGTSHSLSHNSLTVHESITTEEDQPYTVTLFCFLYSKTDE